MFNYTRSMRNSNDRASRSGASCDAMDHGLLGWRALCVRLFVLSEAVLGLLLSLLISLLISRSKLLPLRIS